MEEKNKNFLDKISSFSLILIMVILSMIGAALVTKLQFNHRPSSKQGSTLHVSCSWAGASPRVIEQEVTSKLEGMVSAVNGVESVSSLSAAGGSAVTIQVKKGANVSAVRFEIASLLKQVASKLPEGVSYPSLGGGNVNGSEESEKQLLSYRLNADMRQDQIKEYAETNIKPRLEQLDGVTTVDVSGGMPQVLEISYDPIALASYGLSASDLAGGIRNFLGQSTIIGDVDHLTADGELSRITLHLKTSTPGSDLSKIPVAECDGKVVYLGSVAEMTYREQVASSYYRINGLNTVYLSVSVDAETNIIAMSKVAREEMDKIKLTLIDNYYVDLINDAAEEISLEINKLVRRTCLSLLILLVFVWLVSRSMRYLSIIAITLVSNVLISVIFYYLFDVELHIFSLAGIAVSFGILIDTSIVMVDHYGYYRDRKAFLAILAALLTTIGSLVIIFFMPENVRNELSDFSAIIIINLSVALLVSLFFVPALVKQIDYRSSESTRKFSTRRLINKHSKFYRKYIRFTQRRKWIYVLILVLAFGLPVHLLPNRITPRNYSEASLEWYEKLYNKTIGSNFYQATLKEPLNKALGGTLRLFSKTDGSFSRISGDTKMMLNIRGAMPEGGTAAQLNEKIKGIEALLAKYDEIKVFETRVSDGGATIKVEFTDEALETSFPYQLESEVISEALSIGGADWATYGVSERGFSNALNLSYKQHKISIAGYSYDRLFTIADQLVNEMSKEKRVADLEIQSSSMNYYRQAKELNEMYVKYDMQTVALYNYNLRAGYSTLSSMLSTTQVGDYKLDSGEKVAIQMVSSECDNFDVWNLFNRYVTVGDKQIKYSLLGEIGQRKARATIQKENQEYSLSVAFNYLGSYDACDRYIKGVTEELNASLPVGFKCLNTSYGYYQNKGEQYWLIFIIVAIIFFVCAILFESLIQPLVIISLIPVSFIGTMLTFYLGGMRFSTGGLASLVLLCGLVVNAAIYIINEYNILTRFYTTKRIHPSTLFVKAYNHKIIPVLLTIFSTVLGLFPFLLDGKAEEFWFSFAIGTTGGLLFSILALYLFMPIFLPLRTKEEKQQLKQLKRAKKQAKKQARKEKRAAKKQQKAELKAAKEI